MTTFAALVLAWIALAALFVLALCAAAKNRTK